MDIMKNLDMWDKSIQNFLTVTNIRFYIMTMTLNNHHSVIMMLTKAITIQIKEKRQGFYDTYSTAFEDLSFFQH